MSIKASQLASLHGLYFSKPVNRHQNIFPLFNLFLTNRVPSDFDLWTATSPNFSFHVLVLFQLVCKLWVLHAFIDVGIDLEVGVSFRKDFAAHWTVCG